jgi:hypothetical protein
MRLGWDTRNTYRILVGKSLGKHPPRRLRSRWRDNNKLVLRKTGCEDHR